MPYTLPKAQFAPVLCVLLLSLIALPLTSLATDAATVTDAATATDAATVTNTDTVTSLPDDGELMIDESYQVGAGDNLVISVNDADVEIETYDGSEATIEVYLNGKNMDKARTFFEDQNFEVTREGEDVYVRTFPKRRNYNWNQIGGAQILVKVRIPSEFNLNIKTDDGDVLVDDAQGEVLLKTSDGDIFTGAFSGPLVQIRTSDGDIETGTLDADEVSIVTSDGDISLEDVSADQLRIRTSDGDIYADYLAGVSTIRTSDGDISIQSLEGDEITVRTSDGEIKAGAVDAGSAEFLTSDGNIRLDEVSGELTAKTSDGNLEVTLVDPANINLRAGGGDVYVRAPEDYSAELYMKGERVQMSSGFQFDGTLKKNQANGEINGGRFTFEARSSGGRVTLERN